MTRWWTVALALALLVQPGAAFAEESTEAAQAAFTAGQEAFQRKDYKNAALQFERASALVASGAAWFNAGLSWEAAGDAPRAATAFDTALASAKLQDAQQNEATERLARLRRRLGVVRLRGAGRVSVAHLNNVSPPVDIYLEPGSHVLLVREGNKPARRLPVTVAAGEVADVQVEAPGSVPQRRATPMPAPSLPPDEPETRSGARPYGFAAYGLAAVAAGASIYVGLNALEARDDFEASGRTNADDHDRAARLRTWSNVAAGAAVVFVALGTYLVFFADSSTTKPGKARRRPELVLRF